MISDVLFSTSLIKNIKTDNYLFDFWEIFTYICFNLPKLNKKNRNFFFDQVSYK